MSAVSEIEDAVRQLPEEERARLRVWFAEYDAEVWRRQFERDAKEGRLDWLAEEGLRDHREGRCTEL